MSEQAGSAADAVYSCVMDQSPLYRYQSLIWAHCLQRLVGATRLVVHAVHGSDRAHLDGLRSLGVEVQEVAVVDRRSGYANKLAQLQSKSLLNAEFVILTDCDIAFTKDISNYMWPEGVSGKIVDVGQPNLAAFKAIFRVAGLKGDLSGAPASHADEMTVRHNLNGGLYIVPSGMIEMLRDGWPRWSRWILDNEEQFDKPTRMHFDQVAFALTMTEQDVPVQLLPVAANFPTHLPYEGADRDVISPSTLHYHDRLDRDGRLQLTGMRGVDEQITAANDVIAAIPKDLRNPALQALRDWQQTKAPPKRRPRRWVRVLARLREGR